MLSFAFSNPLPRCVVSRWTDSGSAVFTSHGCDNGLLVLVKNYCRSCCSISVRSINSIFWQIEVALIRKLRFHSSEGEMWSDTSKDFLGWLSQAGGWWQKGKCISLGKKKQERRINTTREALHAVSYWQLTQGMWGVVKRVQQESRFISANKL